MPLLLSPPIPIPRWSHDADRFLDTWHSAAYPLEFDERGKLAASNRIWNLVIFVCRQSICRTLSPFSVHLPAKAPIRQGSHYEWAESNVRCQLRSWRRHKCAQTDHNATANAEQETAAKARYLRNICTKNVQRLQPGTPPKIEKMIYCYFGAKSMPTTVHSP